MYMYNYALRIGGGSNVVVWALIPSPSLLVSLVHPTLSCWSEIEALPHTFEHPQWSFL